MSVIIATLAALSLAAAPLVPAKGPAKAPAKDHQAQQLAAKPGAGATSTEEKAALEAMSKASGHKVVPGRRVAIETTKGKIVVVLFDKDSPKTAENFAKLVKKGFYNGTPFHRVIEGFVAQGGDPTGTGTGDPGYKIPFEKNSLKHVTGALGMARSMSLDSGGSQFFIDFNRLTNLDQEFDASGNPSGGYVVFGHVVQGMDVVRKFTRTFDNNGPISGAKPDKIVKARMM